MTEEFENFAIDKQFNSAFYKVLLPKMKNGERINLFFATGFYNPNYYYLSQLSSLAKFAKYENVHFYIFLADMDVLHKRSKQQTTSDTAKLLGVNLGELKEIMLALGVPPKNFHILRLGVAWLTLFEKEPNSLIDFFNAMSSFDLNKLTMPQDLCELNYRPTGYKYGISLLFRKFIESFVAYHLHRIYPEEIEGKINLVVSGAGSYPISLSVRNLLVDINMLPFMPPVISLPTVPCFGRGEYTPGGFLIPDWSTDAAQILDLINAYNVPQKHIELVYDLVLIPNLKKFTILNRDDTIDTTTLFDTKKHSKYSLANQRLLLAHDLLRFMQDIKEKTHPAKNPDFVVLKSEEELADIGKILNSELARKILFQANGQYGVTEIANRLGKHIPNISNTISQLKRHNLIFVNDKGKIERSIKTLKIDFK